MIEYPLFSIGLPIYNRPQGLERNLNCSVNRTYSNIEIIIAYIYVEGINMPIF